MSAAAGGDWTRGMALAQEGAAPLLSEPAREADEAGVLGFPVYMRARLFAKAGREINHDVISRPTRHRHQMLEP